MTSPMDTAVVEIIPDFSRFASEAEEGVTVGLRGVQSAATEVTDSLDAQFAELASQISADFEVMGAKVDAVFEEMQISADHNMSQMANHAEESSGRIGGAFAKAAGLVKLGAIGVGTALAGVAGFGLKTAANLEQVQVAFDSLTGSVAAGTKQFKDLQAFAAATPFQFTDLTTAAERFDSMATAIGQTRDQMIPFLTTIGNLVSETGGGAQSLDSISLALGQTASQGKLTLGNLEQINNAIPGFSSVAAIAAVRGETTAQVMQELSKGTIDAKTGVNQLLEGMQRFPGAAGAMQKQSLTLLGVFSTFKDTVGQSLSGAFAPAIPAIKDQLTKITPIIGDALKQIGPALGQVVAGILPVLSSLLQGLVPILIPILDALTAAFKILAPILPPLGAAIGLVLKALEPLVPILSQIIAQLVTALTPVIAALAPIVAELAKPLGDILLALMPLIPPLGELLVSAVQLIEPFVKLTAVILKFLTAKALVPIVQLLVPLLSGLADAIGSVAKWIDKIDWRSVADGIGKFFSGIGDFFVNIWNGIIDFFEKLPGRIGSFLSSLPSMLANLASKALHMMFYAIGFGIGLIIKEFINLPGQIWHLVTMLWNGVVDLFTKVIPRLIGKVQEMRDKFISWIAKMWSEGVDRARKGVDNMVSWFEKLPGRVVAWVQKLPSMLGNLISEAAHWLYNMGKNIVQGMINGIESMASSALKAVENLGSDMLKGIGDALGISSPSKEFMKVGHQVVQGFVIGVQQSSQKASDATGNMVNPGGLVPHVPSTGGVVFGPGSVVVQFAGGVPSTQEALATGHAVGQGIVNVLAQRNVRTAIRGM